MFKVCSCLLCFQRQQHRLFPPEHLQPAFGPRPVQRVNGAVVIQLGEGHLPAVRIHWVCGEQVRHGTKAIVNERDTTGKKNLLLLSISNKKVYLCCRNLMPKIKVCNSIFFFCGGGELRSYVGTSAQLHQLHQGFKIRRNVEWTTRFPEIGIQTRDLLSFFSCQEPVQRLRGLHGILRARQEKV